MSLDISQAAGTGIDIDVAGKKWKLMPLTVGDLAALQEDIRSRRCSAARLACAGMPTAQVVEILTDIIQAPIDGETMDREMETMAGCQFSLWRSLKKTHTELTLEKVGEMFAMDELFKAILPVLQSISGLSDGDASPPAKPQETP